MVVTVTIEQPHRILLIDRRERAVIGDSPMIPEWKNYEWLGGTTII